MDCSGVKLLDIKRGVFLGHRENWREKRQSIPDLWENSGSDSKDMEAAEVDTVFVSSGQEGRDSNGYGLCSPVTNSTITELM